jgi:hypothetical protein
MDRSPSNSESAQVLAFSTGHPTRTVRRGTMKIGGIVALIIIVLGVGSCSSVGDR